MDRPINVLRSRWFASFTLALADYEALGGHLDHAIPFSEVLPETGGEADVRPWNGANPWPWKPVTQR